MQSGALLALHAKLASEDTALLLVFQQLHPIILKAIVVITTSNCINFSRPKHHVQHLPEAGNGVSVALACR